MNNYKIISDYKENKKLRKEFSELAKKTFSLDFEKWYQKKLWLDKYKCHSIELEDKIISNISTTEMKMELNGEIKNVIQLGTIMTDKKYRNMGYSRILMDYIFEKYKESDAFFLFANNKVLDFYPKFGFEKQSRKEKLSIEKIEINKKLKFQKLDIYNYDDFKKLKYIIENRVNKKNSISFKTAHEILYFYLIVLYTNDIYIDKEKEIIIIYSFDNSKLNIYDIISTKEVSYKNILENIIKKDTNKINFEFDIVTNDIKIETVEYNSDDDQLFVKGNIDLSQHVFPSLYHA